MKSGLSRRSFLKVMGSSAAVGGFTLSGLSGISRAFAAHRFQGVPTLSYIFPGAPQPDVARVVEALNAYMAERIGATIDLRAIEWGTFDTQISLINASAEPYDLVFTAPWINNYYNNISQEYLAPLEGLLPELAPGYWASLTPATWEAARVAGHIYGAPNQQIFVKPFGPNIRTDLLEAIGLSDEFQALTSWDQLDPIMAAINEYVQTDDILTHVTYNLAQVVTPEAWNYDPQDFGLAVKGSDASAQVVIFSETDEYRQAAELIRQWYVAGYSPSDQTLLAEMDQAWTAGLYGLRMADIVKPGGEAETAARWGHAVTAKAISQPMLTTGGVTATMYGLSSISPNPELSVKFLELVNTDPVFYNTLCKGIEGVHWEWADEERLLIKPAGDAASFADTGYSPNTDWMFGNVFNSYYTDESQVGAWPLTAELNRTAMPSPVLGFTFDRSAVETEISSISAAMGEFSAPVNQGFIDPAEGITLLNQALRDAGIEAVRDEMQSQIDAWKAANA